MPIHKSEVQQRRSLREKRGQGNGAGYAPFLQIERWGFQSRGRSHLWPNIGLGRQHHLLSDLELQVFLAIWRTRPLDCREQYPLQLFMSELRYADLRPAPPGSLEVARLLGVRHPAFARERPRVMTTDFLVDLHGLQVAAHVKYRSELEAGGAREEQKRAIEGGYWRARGVRYDVVDETTIDTGDLDLMLWAVDGMNYLRGDDQEIERTLRALDQTRFDLPMRARLQTVAQKLNLDQAYVTVIFKHAILRRLWRAAPGQKNDLSIPWSGKRSTGKAKPSWPVRKVR
jgi:hypothetical protein